MQTSVDGFVAAASSELVWQLWDWAGTSPWDGHLVSTFNDTLARSDRILLSPMVDGGYLDHWAAVARAHPREPAHAGARRVGAIEKVVVSRTAPRARGREPE